MTVGELRQKVEIQAPRPLPPDRSPEGDPEPAVAFETIARRWAKLEPVSGNETWQQQQVQAEVTHTLTLRYLASLTPACRVLYQGRVFHLVSCLNVGERNEWTVCQAVEQVSCGSS